LRLLSWLLSLVKKQPLVLFAVLFYYLAHAIESSFFPIFDVLFEHRTYLPNLGLALLSALLLVTLLQKSNYNLFVWLLSASLLLWFSYLSISRNSVWNDPIKIYQTETHLSPKKERVWSELGKYYLKKRQFSEALQNLGTALNLGRDGNTLNALPTTFLNTYLALLYTNQLDKALFFEKLVPLDKLSKNDLAIFYFMKGNRLTKTGKNSEAINSYKQALSINPLYLDAKANLAAVYIAKKNINKAKSLLTEVLKVNPQHKMALFYQKQL